VSGQAGEAQFVATLLVGSTAVAYVPPSGRVAHVATNTAGPAIKVGLEPVGIAITPNGKTVYVANEMSRTVSPIHT
jgi:DNA-binding beta-propeller fold protein YncE